MKSERVRMAMVVVAVWGFGVAWRPLRSLGQCCGDCNGNGAVTVDELITAANNALGQCATPVRPTGAFPASGQTTAYGTGSDGDVKAGAALSYTDNGDGTITDHNTGLMWEKKDDSGGIHGQNNAYTWWGGVTSGYLMDGTMVTTFLSKLNTPPCFASHCDWRIPNVRELQSIVDYENVGPAVNAAFHNAAGCTGCTDVRLASCSCTQSSSYWSSTTYQDFPTVAWYVYFFVGYVGFNFKSDYYYVRAVRGGS